MASSSTSSSLDDETEELEIPAMLLEYEEAIAKFVREPLVQPRWHPQTAWANAPSWTEEDIARMESTHFPETPFDDDKPDMLLYALGNLESLDPAFPARLADFLSGSNHLLLEDRSGAGKTRIIFESFCQRWGLYFTCSSNSIVSPYGSNDIGAAIYSIITMDFTHVLHPLNKHSRKLKENLLKNQAKLRILTAQVVLARLLVFHVFYRCMAACGLPPDDARKKWLVLQLRPHYVFDTDDIFTRLSESMHDWTCERLCSWIRRLQRSSAGILEFVALDEAQVAGRSYDKAFTSPDRLSYRTLLYQLVVDLVFLCPKQRLIISGVSARHAPLQEAVLCAGSDCNLRQFMDLGMFGTLERVRYYLSHFQLSDKLDCQTVFSWLRGRHRVLAVFVAYCLLAGPRRWRSVLGTMLYKLTDFYDFGEPLIDAIKLGPLISPSMLEDSDVAWTLRHALYLRAMHSQQTVTLDRHASVILTLALGRYGPDTSTVLIDEPLIFLSLYKWLLHSRSHAFPGLLKAASEGRLLHLRRTGFFENLALVLQDAHVKRFYFNDIFEVVAPCPLWATRRFRLSLAHHAGAGSSTWDKPSQLIADASSPDDVFAWFRDAQSPFLVPDDACGVDMFCFLRITADHHLLVCFQAERPASRSLRPRHRIAPTHPSMFYTQDTTTHKRWLQILRTLETSQSPKLSVLRVVCYGQPLSMFSSPKAHVAILSHDYLMRHAYVDISLDNIVCVAPELVYIDYTRIGQLLKTKARSLAVPQRYAA